MMGAFHFSCILVIIAVFGVLQIKASSIKEYHPIIIIPPELNATVSDGKSHLKSDILKNICMSRDLVCKSNHTNVCAARNKEDKLHYKDFENSCYLFFSNICEYANEEYYITAAGNCTAHLDSRRHIQAASRPRSTARPVTNATKTVSNGNRTVVSPGSNGTATTRPHSTTTRVTNAMRVIVHKGNRTHLSPGSNSTGLRQQGPPAEIPDHVERSTDNHVCPRGCAELYRPMCMLVNRMRGKYFKVYYFLNHCEADRFVCAKYDEFEIEPGAEYAEVHMSKLDWAFCGHTEYINFAIFAESAASMGHYGWLQGKQRFSHIMDPHQRHLGLRG
ncbi:uncharacterized protein LOC126911754 isoform X2 [Spodoptera frugiperda]|uniref:Uncharacterized protein LOC126911754 isoform X2 n=1 Tax=Spodoptera frugiperda TaxID=7108 RepID=A0A9R0DZJ3_SPOFR|nr:uncharacterized protein LOC126911754 isoform X2 [Spodoptera frugiperda]